MSGRVLFHVQHLLGVGHAKRAAVVARAMVSRGLDVLVVLGGEPMPLVDFGAARTVQLPPARAADTSFKLLLDAHGQPVDHAWWEQRTRSILEVAAAFRPDALLVEHFPFGRRRFGRELEPLFHHFKASSSGPILCSVRDVLVAKDDATRTQQTVELVQRWFDCVLVHGDPSVIPFDTTFTAAQAIEDRIEYTGYVVEDEPPVAGSDEGAGRDEIVVSTGGGAVGESLLAVAIEAAAGGALAPRRWRLLAGANLPEPVFQRLRQRSGNRALVERARPDFRQLLSRCRLSISQAGYNTLMDICTCRCRALVVPFAAKGESEQLFRARKFERRGVLVVLEEDLLTPATLARAAENALTLEPSAAMGVDLGGAARTAEAVATIMKRRVGAAT